MSNVQSLRTTAEQTLKTAQVLQADLGHWTLDKLGRGMENQAWYTHPLAGEKPMRMKTSLFVISVVFTATACSLIWSPTAAVKKFMSAAEKGDVRTMTDLFSSKAVARIGRDKIETNNQNFADMMGRAKGAGNTYSMTNLTEKTMPEGARVAFFYRSNKGNDSLRLVFDLVRENGAWKIDDIGGADKESPGEPSPEASPSASMPEAPPPPPGTSGATSTKSLAAPVSGGLLNGKATNLPQPSYPPVAKAAKASGNVTVQVTIDEEGNVVAAHAVSGHPLLQAAAVAAAREAKFTPTKLSGKPVKVTGIITYNFVLP